jgi:transposase
MRWRAVLGLRGVGRTSTALGAFYSRLAVRFGNAKAITATARRLVLLVYGALSDKLGYLDPGAIAYLKLHRARELQSLRSRANLLASSRSIAPPMRCY